MGKYYSEFTSKNFQRSLYETRRLKDKPNSKKYKDSLNEAIEGAMPFIRHTAASFYKDHPRLDFHQLISLGMNAAWKAVPHYDPKKATFSHFLYICMRKVFSRYGIEETKARERIPTVSLDAFLQNDVNGLTRNKFDELQAQIAPHLKEPSPNSIPSVYDLLASPEVDLEKILHPAMSILKQEDREILSWYFGRKNGREYTCEEIGLKYGLTRAAIGSRIKNSLLKLRDYFEEKFTDKRAGSKKKKLGQLDWEQIRKIMEQAGGTRREIADQIGISRSGLDHILGREKVQSQPKEYIRAKPSTLKFIKWLYDQGYKPLLE